MSSPHNRGRRVPPKGVGPRPDPGPHPAVRCHRRGSIPVKRAPRQRTRSANRAAKRAATGVRPKQVRRGSVKGRQSRSASTGLILLAIAAVAVAAAVFVLGNPFGAPAASPSAAANATPVPSHGDGTCPTSQPASLAPGEVRNVTIETAEGHDRHEDRWLAGADRHGQLRRPRGVPLLRRHRLPPARARAS